MKRRPKLVGAAWIVALALAAYGWWFMRAPTIEHAVWTSPPDIDIDSPTQRARHKAEIALATLPDDPWTFAEAIGASAPAKAADKEDCGIAGGPRFDKPAAADDPPVQLRGASPRFVNAQARIDAALRASADPLDHVVADLANAGDMRTEAGRDEAVVQQAAQGTDPRVYAIGYGLCHEGHAAPPSCRSISLERWIQLDPGNGMPLVEKLGQQRARGDTAGVRATLSQLAQATRFDTYFRNITGAVASRMTPDDQDLAAVNDLMARAATQAENLPMPEFQPLIQVCRDKAGGNAELERMCRATSDTMYEHSDDLLTYSLSGPLLLKTTGDASRNELIHAERAVFAAHWSPATGFSECQDLRDTLKSAVRAAQVGQVQALREQARKFVTP